MEIALADDERERNKEGLRAEHIAPRSRAKHHRNTSTTLRTNNIATRLLAKHHRNKCGPFSSGRTKNIATRLLAKHHCNTGARHVPADPRPSRAPVATRKRRTESEHAVTVIMSG